MLNPSHFSQQENHFYHYFTAPFVMLDNEYFGCVASIYLFVKIITLH